MTMEKRSPERRDTSTYQELIWIALFNPHFRYFGRAKDLPGVRELFQSRKNEEEEENQVLAYYKKFMNQGPAYYGDLDEDDGKLLAYEREAEDEGVYIFCGIRDAGPHPILRLGRSIYQCARSPRFTIRHPDAKGSPFECSSHSNNHQ